MTERQCICEACGLVFTPGWSEEEALAEMRQNYGENAKPENFAVVCGDCFEKIEAFRMTIQ